MDKLVAVAVYLKTCKKEKNYSDYPINTVYVKIDFPLD